MIIMGFIIQATSSGSNVDVWGHVGGLIFGFCMLPLLQKPILEDDGICCKYNYWFWSCLIIIVGFGLGGFLGFYFGK